MEDVVESSGKAVALGLIFLMATVTTNSVTAPIVEPETMENTITVTGLPSKAGYDYVYSTHTYVDYCPLCGAKDSLIYHTGWYKGTYVPEGELSCTRCGADYCCVTGLDKSYNIRAGLTKA